MEHRPFAGNFVSHLDSIHRWPMYLKKGCCKDTRMAGSAPVSCLSHNIILPADTTFGWNGNGERNVLWISRVYPATFCDLSSIQEESTSAKSRRSFSYLVSQVSPCSSSMIMLQLPMENHEARESMKFQ